MIVLVGNLSSKTGAPATQKQSGTTTAVNWPCTLSKIVGIVAELNFCIWFTVSDRSFGLEQYL